MSFGVPGVTVTPTEVNGTYMGLSGAERVDQGGGVHPLAQSELDKG